MIRTTLLPLTMSMIVATALATPAATGQQVVQSQRASQSIRGGQSAEAQWLDTLPADLPIVVRVGGMQQATNNLVTMMRAMSPNLAEQLGSQIQATVSEFTRSLGAGQGEAAALVLIDVVTPDEFGEQVELEGAQLQVKPRAIAVFQTQDYRGALASIAGQQNLQPEQRDGYDVVTVGNGEQIFAVQKQGFAAVTQHEDLIKKVTSAPEQNLGHVMTDEMKSHFLDGDLGVYVDLASINDAYADQGEQVRGFLRQQVDELREENPETAQQIRTAYQQVFKAAENARCMAANASFAEQGLSVSGKLLMNDDYEPIRQMADQGDDPADELAKLPRGSAYYAFNMLDPETIEWNMIPSGDQIEEDFPEIAKVLESPEFDQANEQFRKAGLMRSSASLGLGESRQGICVIEAEDAPALIDAVRSSVEAIKGRDFSLIKDLTIETEAQQHEGYTFDKIAATYDFDAFTKEVEEQTEEVKNQVQQKIDDENINQNIDEALADRPIDREEAVAALRRIVGESTTIWVGTDGSKTLSVLAENWDDAQSQIDSYLANDQGIGETESYQKVRAELPDRVRALTMVDVQTGFRQILGELRQATEEDDLRAPEQTPEQTTMIGMAVVAEPDGLRFKSFMPSEVGPVIEKGIVPVIERQLEQQQNQGQ
ncbi:hypothetical protein [Tautonia marina]|uniref:hypothetical protein n=1 Tax=Tautonia marina TaxID=2653855 RepID=UPI001260FEAB|nr:hypothetical protein [Tautonia marina]